MMPTRSVKYIISALAAAAVSVPTVGQPQAIRDGDGDPVPVDAPIGSVTVYNGRAMITRTRSLSVRSGVYTLRFDHLPASIQPNTLQARVTGPASVLSVEFETTRDVERPPAIVALDDAIAGLLRQVRECDDKVSVIEAQEHFVDAVTVQATKEAAAGSAAESTLDPEAVRRHLMFIAEERTRLLAERRSLEEEKLGLETTLLAEQARRDALAEEHTLNRFAIVSLAVTNPAEVRLDVSYLVSNATWEPTYNVRTMGGGSSIRIEYDALLTQATGEDWTNVALTLSTAEPIQNANPPELRPLFVDAVDGQQPGGEAVLLDMQAELPDPTAAAQRLALGDVPTVTYQMPRPVTVQASDGRQKRTRIADIDTYASFRHIAVPLLTDAVYVRGDILNNSAQQLLPAPASVFIGPDYIGPTALGSVAAFSPFELFFGIDEKVKARRSLVSKKTESTGLFGGGLKTTYEYRIEIENGSGKDIELELWDRQPVSRSEQIKVELFDMSHRLAGDAVYVDEQRGQGLLKWVITVPATARGNSPLVVTYGVRVNRSKDVETTPLP